MNPEPTSGNYAHSKKQNSCRQIKVIYLIGRGHGFLRVISRGASPLPSAPGRKILSKGRRILLHVTILSSTIPVCTFL